MWRKWDWELAAIVVGLAAIVLAVTGGRITSAVPAVKQEMGTEISRQEMAGPVVHVTGAVVRPGVYRLKPGDRVADAIEAAGGAVQDGDINRLNLAAVATDGMRVLVPRVDDGADSGDEDVVNINRACGDDLERLPGIGPALAARIIAHRQQHGSFFSVDDLAQVPGIGPATVERLRPLVRTD